MSTLIIFTQTTQNMKLWKYSGTLLIGTGILHTLVAVIIYNDIFIEIIQSGIINTVNSYLPRKLAFWFLLCGVFIILWGLTMHYYIKKTQAPVPRFIGWILLAISVITCLFVPISGAWLFIPQALIIISAKEDISC